MVAYAFHIFLPQNSIGAPKWPDFLQPWPPVFEHAKRVTFEKKCGLSLVLCSAPSVPQPVFTITEKAPMVTPR